MTELTKDDVLAVGYARLSHIDKDFPTLDRANYGSEQEYLQALQQQYLALRQQEYEYICMHQTYETYLASRCVNDKTCRSIMYSAEAGVVFNKMSELCVDEEEPSRLEDIDEKYKIFTEKSDSTVVNATGMKVHECHRVTTTGDKQESTSAHCAMTSLCNVGGISRQLGYTGKEDFTYGALDSANAALIHSWDSSIGGKKTDSAICGGAYSNTSKDITVKSLILSGELGPGDIISHGNDVKGSPHGYHALTIASVNRNEQGEIVSYTVMDNNGGTAPKTSLVVHDINNPKDDLNQKRVLYTKTHQWANDKFNNEIAGKSAEELEAMIAGTKDRICKDVIVDLSRSECALLLDESYIKSCGTTIIRKVNGKIIGGLSRAPGLKSQQDAFCTFYAEHNKALINEGTIIVNEEKADIEAITNNTTSYNEADELDKEIDNLFKRILKENVESTQITKLRDITTEIVKSQMHNDFASAWGALGTIEDAFATGDTKYFESYYMQHFSTFMDEDIKSTIEHISLDRHPDETQTLGSIENAILLNHHNNGR